MAKRGRPRKFDEPYRTVSFNLPDAVIDQIRETLKIDSDGLALQAWIMHHCNARHQPRK